MRAEYLQEVIANLIDHGTIGYIHDDKMEEIFGSGSLLEQREITAAFNIWSQQILERINSVCSHAPADRSTDSVKYCKDCGATRQYISNDDHPFAEGYWTNWQ